MAREGFEGLDDHSEAFAVTVVRLGEGVLLAPVSHAPTPCTDSYSPPTQHPPIPHVSPPTHTHASQPTLSL